MLSKATLAQNAQGSVRELRAQLLRHLGRAIGARVVDDNHLVGRRPEGEELLVRDVDAPQSIAIQVPFDVLLLDEVLAVGDEHFQEKCFATFKQFKGEGKTVIFVSHGLDLMTRFCTRVMLLENGVVRVTGPPDDVIDLYLSTCCSTDRALTRPSDSTSTQSSRYTGPKKNLTG